MDVKNAIDTGDATTLSRLLAADPALANKLIFWGSDDCIQTHPLHYVSDMRFNRILPSGKDVPLIEALIAAGADLDFQRNGQGDTPLIGAASLGAEDVGLTLLNAGACPELRGVFGETALHWAAMMGADRLVRRLIDDADLEIRDEQYGSSPLGWAFHGWCEPEDKNHAKQEEVILLLIAAGAKVEPEWLETTQALACPSVLSALRNAVIQER